MCRHADMFARLLLAVLGPTREMPHSDPGSELGILCNLTRHGIRWLPDEIDPISKEAQAPFEIGKQLRAAKLDSHWLQWRLISPNRRGISNHFHTAALVLRAAGGSSRREKTDNPVLSRKAILHRSYDLTGALASPTPPTSAQPNSESWLVAPLLYGSTNAKRTRTGERVLPAST